MFNANPQADLYLVNGELWADASSLGLAPGEWPDAINVGGRVFRFPSIERKNDEVRAVKYRVAIGTARLVVLND